MRIAFLGTGTIGASMAVRLGRHGHALRLWNRTPHKAEAVADALINQDATVFETPAEAVRNAELVITMLEGPAAVDAVTRRPDGILAEIGPDTPHCDMSTVSPAFARELEATYRSHARQFVHAPVLGSRPQATDGTLLVFAGGVDESVVVRAGTVFGALAKRIWRFPDAATAAATKLACNLLIGQMMTGLAQSLVFAEKHGVAGATLLEILGASALGSAMYASKGQKILDQGFADANFYVRHMLKDLVLARDSAGAAGLTLPSNDTAIALYEQAVADGLGQLDYAAVIRVLTAG